MTALPLHHLAFELSRRWLARYEARELDAVVVYRADRPSDGKVLCGPIGSGDSAVSGKASGMTLLLVVLGLAAVAAGWSKKATAGRRAPG